MDQNTFEKTINFTLIQYIRLDNELQPTAEAFKVPRKVTKKEAVRILKENNVWGHIFPGSLQLHYSKRVYRMSIEYFTEVAEQVG